MKKIFLILVPVLPMIVLGQTIPKQTGKTTALSKEINFSDSLKIGKYALVRTRDEGNNGTPGTAAIGRTALVEFVSLPFQQHSLAGKIELSPLVLSKTISAGFNACLEFPHGLRKLKLRNDPAIILRKSPGNSEESSAYLYCRVRENKRYLVSVKVKDADNSATDNRIYFIQMICASVCPRMDYTIWGAGDGTLSFVIDNSGYREKTVELQISSAIPGEFSLMSCIIEEL